ncbi:hypothetical protein ASG73_01690 [Janibacter sp. Soil728]|uniref:hypothetical protein n=1 Tax=Janibacter sp. Soil728 TaxID=1736393 RepID=UPI000700998A|nr:hypothetical protein [Janibacter sp. Soil728]KRE39091.1 hypothetical protein ASG73_01690 [Janibacter sp. Soil728]
MSTRPRTTTPPPPQQPRSSGIEVGLLPLIAGIVGVLLVCGVIGGVLWATRDGAEEPVATQTEATQPGGAVAGAPDLRVRLDGETLVFTFDYTGLQEGDYFRIRTGGDPDAVTGTPVRVDGTEFRLGVAPGVQQCGTVQVVRGAQRSAWSQVQCETVRKS